MARKMRTRKTVNDKQYFDDEPLSLLGKSSRGRGSRGTRSGRNERVNDTFTPRKKEVLLLPRNSSQANYVDCLLDDTLDIVIAVANAGSGKTFLATQYAIKQLQEGKIDKIIIARPAVCTDEEHGFLKGTLIEKLSPYLHSILQVFKDHYSVKEVEYMLENEIIEICPLAYAKGRTFRSPGGCVVLVTEAQNATVNQIRMLTTRIGIGSKLILDGDPTQCEKGFEYNGLVDLIKRVKKHKPQGIEICEFDKSHIERHPLIETILKMYED